MKLDVNVFPNKAAEYKDELLCLIKDKPNPERITLL